MPGSISREGGADGQGASGQGGGEQAAGWVSYRDADTMRGQAASGR